MKILLKRNKSIGSIMQNTSGGEPIWYKDRLYIGSVGTSAGGMSTTGTTIEVGATIHDTKIEQLTDNTYEFKPDCSRGYVVLTPSENNPDITILIDITSADSERYNNSNEHYILVHAVNGDASVTFSVIGDCLYKFYPQNAIVVPAGAAMEFSVKIFIPADSDMNSGYVIVTNSSEIQPQ